MKQCKTWNKHYKPAARWDWTKWNWAKALPALPFLLRAPQQNEQKNMNQNTTAFYTVQSEEDVCVYTRSFIEIK